MTTTPSPTRLIPLQFGHLPIGWSYAALALSALFAVYISYIRPPEAGFFTTDEQFIADSGVFMLYGTTPRCLDWPGIPMVLVIYLVALGQCGLNILTEAMAGHLTTVDVFRVIDQTAYAYMLDRAPIIQAGRTVQLLLVFGLLTWSVRIIHQANADLLPPVLRFPLVVLLCLSFDMLVGSPVLRPEGLAYALFITTATLVLFGSFKSGSWRMPAIVLLLMALLISQRLLFMFTFPFLLGTLLIRVGFSWTRALSALVLLGVGTLLTMPFLLTDTFIIAKAFVGGMVMKVNGAAQDTYFNWPYVRQSVLSAPTAWQIALLVVGSVVFWQSYPHRGIAALLLGNLLLLSVSVFHASVIYHTHTLPLRCMGLFILLYGAYGLYRATRRTWVLYSLMAAFVVSNALESLIMLRGNFLPNPMWQVAAYLRTLPANSRVLIDARFDNLLPRSRATLLRELHAIQNPALTKLKYERQLKVSLSGQVPVAMSAILSEDERLAIVQRQVQSQWTPDHTFADLFFFADNVGFVNYFVNQKTAFADFEQGRYDYLITYERFVHREPTKVFASTDYWVPFFLYTTTSPLP